MGTTFDAELPMYARTLRCHPPQILQPSDHRASEFLRHSPVGGNKMLAGTIVRARIYDRALEPSEVAAKETTHAEDEELDDGEISDDSGDQDPEADIEAGKAGSAGQAVIGGRASQAARRHGIDHGLDRESA